MSGDYSYGEITKFLRWFYLTLHYMCLVPFTQNLYLKDIYVHYWYGSCRSCSTKKTVCGPNQPRVKIYFYAINFPYKIWSCNPSSKKVWHCLRWSFLQFLLSASYLSRSCQSYFCFPSFWLSRLHLLTYASLIFHPYWTWK